MDDEDGYHFLMHRIQYRIGQRMEISVSVLQEWWRLVHRCANVDLFIYLFICHIPYDKTYDSSIRGTQQEVRRPSITLCPKLVYKTLHTP